MAAAANKANQAALKKKERAEQAQRDQAAAQELPGIREEELSDEEPMMRKIAKPTYFNLFDEAHVDTEDELVAGENNYVEIKCLPMEDDEE